MDNTSYTSPTTKPLFRGIQIVQYVLMIVEVLLAFRFILKFMAANPVSSFTSFIYGITQSLVQPFIAVFQITPVEGGIVEWTTLLAMLVYWIIAEIIIRLFFMSKTVSTSEAAEELNKNEDEKKNL